MDGEEPTDGDDPPPDRARVSDGGERQCVNCGAQLSRYSKFCSECGTEQESGADTGQDASGQSTADRWTGGDGQPEAPRRQPGGRGQGGATSQGRANSEAGRRRPPGGGQESGGRQSGRGQQRRPGGQRRGGQGYAGQPDRLQTAGPDSSTGLAALAHVLALFTGLFGPIILYALTSDPFVKENAANATNWQIVLIAYNFTAFILIFVVVFIAEILALLAILVVFGLIGANLIFILIGGIKAMNGEAWSYPITPDLL